MAVVKRRVPVVTWAACVIHECSISVCHPPLFQPLRAALSGTTVSPGIFDVMVVLGREETLGRLDDVLESP